MTTLMQGFPPEGKDQATLANWRSAPYASWAFHHVREIVPSAEIPHDPDNIRKLIPGSLSLPEAEFSEILDRTSTDAVAVIQGDKLLFETYRNGMTARSPHILMSVSKSLLGLVAGTLIEKGELKEDDKVESFIPELGKTAWAGATIRNLLDMRSGVLFDEDYLATSGPIIDYRYAANWNPLPEGREPGDLRSFMSLLTESGREHGAAFQYISPCTDLLAWIFERASGMRYADLFSERLLRPAGAETAGYITVDRLGGARAAGGVCLTARDLARIGMLLNEGGKNGAAQVLPASWVEDIHQNGDVEAWRNGNFADKFRELDMCYRSKWYCRRGAEPLVHGLGIHGQYLFADKARNLSIAWFSSRHAPIDEATMFDVFAAVDMIRNAAS